MLWLNCQTTQLNVLRVCRTHTSVFLHINTHINKNKTPHPHQTPPKHAAFKLKNITADSQSTIYACIWIDLYEIFKQRSNTDLYSFVSVPLSNRGAARWGQGLRSGWPGNIYHQWLWSQTTAEKFPNSPAASVAPEETNTSVQRNVNHTSVFCWLSSGLLSFL